MANGPEAATFFDQFDLMDGRYTAPVEYGDTQTTLTLEVRKGEIFAFTLGLNSPAVGLSKADAFCDCLYTSGGFATDGVYRSAFIGDSGDSCDYCFKVEGGKLVAIGVPSDPFIKASAVADATNSCLKQAGMKV